MTELLQLLPLQPAPPRVGRRPEGRRGAHARLSRFAVLLCAALAGGAKVSGAQEAVTDPFLGQPEAIADGEQTYRSKCMICHGKAGGRGPNLFAAKLSDEAFLETVINGRKGTQMPSFGRRLSPDDVWKVRAFLKAHPDGI